MDTKQTKFVHFKTIISLCLLFASSLAFAPEAGAFRTFPVVFFAAVAVGFLKTNAAFCTLFSLAMTLCVYLVSGRGTLQAIFFSLTACLFTFFGIYFARLLMLCFKTKNINVKNKSIALVVAIAVLTAVLSLLLCGNVFMYFKNHKANLEYIQKSYGEIATVKYTFYDALSCEYRTYVSFEDTVKNGSEDVKVIYGEDNSIYVSNRKGRLNDEIRNYFEEKIKESAEHDLEEIILSSDKGFRVVKSDINFPNDELVDFTKGYGAYLNRVNYVVNFDSPVLSGERNMFATECEKALKALEEKEFVYGTIVFCGGDANNVFYCLTADMNVKADAAEEKICEYKQEMTQIYGVSEKDILSYWQNN